MHAPEMGIVLIMAQVYKGYVFQENMLPLDQGNIFPGRHISMSNIFTLIMACLGASKVRENFVFGKHKLTV